MRRTPMIALFVVLGAGVAIQGVPFDCHSNETVWPWYSYAAPIAWFVAATLGSRHPGGARQSSDD